MFDRGGVNIAVAAYFVDHYFLRQKSGSYCCGWLCC